MSSPTSTPSHSEKSEARRQATGDSFQAYYISDEDGNVPRGRDSTPTSPKTKKPAVRKHNPTTPKRTAKSAANSSQESSTTRKSPRIASGGAKRTAKAIEADEAEIDESPSLKKRKVKAKGAATSTAVSTKTIDPAAIQPHTNRFPPINAQIKRAKKVEKRPANSDEADNKPRKRTKKNNGNAAVPAAEANEDFAAMGIAAADNADTKAEQVATKGKRKAKAKTTKNVEPTLTTNNAGSSTEKPDNAPNTTFWRCANRNCNTGQTWYKRDGTGGLGRKVISNFFGRNKKETNLIDSEVWHIYCRKCYQRDTYRDKTVSDKNICQYFIDNVEIQLSRVQIWRPDATFKVQLTKGAVHRLAEYRKELRNNGGDEIKAEQKVGKPHTTNNKGNPKPQDLENAFPIKKMEEFDNNFTTTQSNCDFDALDTIIQWIRSEIQAGRITSMPPMEFLISIPNDSEAATDPATNYNRWTAVADGRTYIEPDAEDDAETETETETETPVAGPSGAQSQDSDTTEIEVEASDSSAATFKQDGGKLNTSSPTPKKYVPSPYERFIGHKRPRTPEYDDDDDEDEYEYGSEEEGELTDNAESESEDEDDDEPVTPTPSAWKIGPMPTVGPMSTSIGVKTTGPGGVMRRMADITADWNRIRAREATSPITPTDPTDPFTTNSNEGEQTADAEEVAKAASLAKAIADAL